MKYEKSYVAGACLLPSYLCGALLLAKASIIVWLIGMLYQWCVLIPINTKLKQWQRYLLTFFAQLVFWGIGIFTLQLN
jgi:hypothetical protein